MANRLGPKWLNQVQQLAGPTHAGRLGRYALLAERVNALEPTLGARDRRPADRAGATPLRLRARQGDSLNGLLVEAFALVREAAKRTIKQRHYDVQLVGGAAIHYRCDRRDGDRRGQDPRRHPAGVPQRLAGQGRPRRHRQRLPRPARRRVDDADLPAARHDRRLHPDRPDRRRSPRGLRLRHHLRHQQGVRLRLPPRRAEAAPARRRRAPQVVRAGLPRAEAAITTAEMPVQRTHHLRDRRRGRQHPDRRGADPADHRRQQPADPGGGRRLLRRRRARRHPRPGQGLQVRPGRAQGRAERRRAGARSRPSPATRRSSR